ncbi:unnamed protein product, partial [Closterium sp. NIES-65]
SLWADPTCGNGSCDRPFQFPAFGRFGCEADCGMFPNLTSVVIRFSSHLDTQQAIDESCWNLCMVNPVSLCWYEAFQAFPRGEAELSVAVDIPDGDWVVVLNAPAGGVRGTVNAPPPGTRRFSVVGATSTVELAAWGSCALDDGVLAANQTAPRGGATVAAPDICRDTCARLVACLPATCGRAFTEREVAGAFLDCARMCIIAPSSITTYAAAPCPMPEIASMFSNTPCNVSGSDATGRVSGGNRRKALFRFHHPRSYERWPASTAPGPHDTLSHPTAAKQRLTVLQVAVSRALFTMAKDRCLAGRAPGASRKHAQGGPGSVSWNMVACLCTILGGPSKTLDECRLTDEAGQRVESIPDMYVYLRCTHVRGGRVISSQHMRRFVQTVAAALRSVTLISDAAAARLKTLMHAFDDAIVTSDAVGCSQEMDDESPGSFSYRG